MTYADQFSTPATMNVTKNAEGSSIVALASDDRSRHIGSDLTLGTSPECVRVKIRLASHTIHTICRRRTYSSELDGECVSSDTRAEAHVPRDAQSGRDGVEVAVRSLN